MLARGGRRTEDGEGTEWARTDCGRQERRRNRGGTDATKGINECGFKRLAGTREAVWAE